MKKICILFISLILGLFLSCGEKPLFFVNGFYLHLPTETYVEIVNDGFDKPSISRIGDDYGIFSKNNPLWAEIEDDLIEVFNNSNKSRDFVAIFGDCGGDIPDWYNLDQDNELEAILGNDGAYCSRYSEFENIYNRVKGVSVNSSEEISVESNEIYAFIQRVDIDGYIFPRITKIFLKTDNNDYYHIDNNVTFFNTYDEESLTMDMIDYFNKNIDNYRVSFNAFAKELEYF